jgi:hypothetical protein
LAAVTTWEQFSAAADLINAMNTIILTKMASTASPVPALAATQAPTVEVRNNEGILLSRINREDAKELVGRGWADAIGKKVIRYLRLRADAPWKPYQKS